MFVNKNNGLRFLKVFYSSIITNLKKNFKLKYLKCKVLGTDER